jgi:hypothetical protein
VGDDEDDLESVLKWFETGGKVCNGIEKSEFALEKPSLEATGFGGFEALLVAAFWTSEVLV